MDIKREIERQATALVEMKSINEVGIGDVQIAIDKSKSYEEQVEDVVSAMATAHAVKDESTVKDITDKKAEELRAKASTKLKDAQTKDIDAETDRQEAERKKYEAVLSTFGITKHLPNWLLRIMVFLFSPIFIALTIVIGVPCGIVKVLIDNVDNILVRYENAETANKPKIKVTVWVIFVLAVLIGVSIVVLKIFDKI